MFHEDFFPTPSEVIDRLLEGLDISGKVTYDPQAGKGNLIDRFISEGAQPLATELNADLRKILQSKCVVIGDDFLKIESHQISHVDFIIMNPPFSKAAEHIQHAFNVAPPGCKIRSLCNVETVKNPYSRTRTEVKTLVDTYGSYENIGDCFAQAERRTNVEVALIRLEKPGENYDQEFAGFFLDDEPEEQTGAGIMSYNVIRDLVNRYIEAMKIFDQQLDTAVRLNEMTSNFFDDELGMQITRKQQPIQRNEFKKALQKSGWKFIFSKLNMAKYATRGLKEDINKFVETQEQIPFTMRNIYRMLEIVIGTQGQRIDKAILEVFERVTNYHDDNRYGLEGWKTNSHYLLTKRFIMPSLCEIGWSGEISPRYSGNFELVKDLIKALCYITGDNFDSKIELDDFMRYRFSLMKDGEYVKDSEGRIVRKQHEYEIKQAQEWHYPGSEIVLRKLEWGQWFEWDYFKIRVYKKGTIHFEFLNDDVWAMFNQRVAKLKGYPLPEQKKQTKYQEKQNGRKSEPKQPKQGTTPKKPVVVGGLTFDFETKKWQPVAA